MEWGAAHGRVLYFALIRAEDELKRDTLQVTDMISYLAECPQGATLMQTADFKWHKFNRRANVGNAAMLSKGLTATHPDLSARPASLATNAQNKNRNPKNVPMMMRYSAAEMAKDQRCAYSSTKFPRHDGGDQQHRRGALPHRAQGERPAGRGVPRGRRQGAGTRHLRALLALEWLWSGLTDGIYIVVVCERHLV